MTSSRALFRLLFTASLLLQPTLAQAAEPRWSSEHLHRLLVIVDPVQAVSRPTDELIASVEIDFGSVLGELPCDLSSLQVVRYDATTGEPIVEAPNPHATTAGDRIFRYDDASIPWEFPEREGYAHNTDGSGLPLRRFPGGGRFLGVVGDGHSGTLRWAHAQTAGKSSHYVVYFNPRPLGSPRLPATRGLLGNGANRCAPRSSSFFPLYHTRIDLGDLDDDGLFDMVAGSMNGTILKYRNSGEASRPVFGHAELIVTSDGEPLDVGYSSAPRLADWDSDGDLDLIVGAEKESFVFFRNTGDRREARFQREGLLRAGGVALRVPKAPSEEDPEGKIYPYDYYPIPEIVDWDGDGDLDLLAGGYITGRVWYYENFAQTAASEPELVFRGALQADGRDLDVTWTASPCAADFDGDGDLDLICGAMQITEGGGDLSDNARFLWYYENRGSRTAPALALRSFPARGEFRHGALATPRAVDWNADGLTDLIVSAALDLLLIPNVGSTDRPVFDASVRAENGLWGNTSLAFQQLVDYNGDGWLDRLGGRDVQLAMGMFEGSVGALSEPGIGPDSEPVKVVPLLAPKARIHHPSPSGDHWDYRAIADLDHDGKLDLLVGVHEGFVWWHRDQGDRENPSVDPVGKRLQLTTGEPLRVGSPPTSADDSPFDALQGARTTMAVGDFDHDGDSDLVVCDTYGVIRVFLQANGENRAFTPGVAIARPQKIRLTAQAVDWNGDGWDDIVATYATADTFLILNRAETGHAAFEAVRELAIPKYPMSWPFLHVADWNHDGDADFIFHYGSMVRFVERSFVEHGYVRGRVVKHERRKNDE